VNYRIPHLQRPQIRILERDLRVPLCPLWLKNRRNHGYSDSPNKIKLAGGSFLIEEHATDQVFTLEDLSEEHQQIAQTTQDFARNEILPTRKRLSTRNSRLRVG